MPESTQTPEIEWGEPTELLSVVTDAEGVEWTRYHTDPTGNGKHWWTSPWVADDGAWCGGWQAFSALTRPGSNAAGDA